MQTSARPLWACLRRRNGQKEMCFTSDALHALGNERMGMPMLMIDLENNSEYMEELDIAMSAFL